MNVQDYFNGLRVVIDRFTTADFVLNTSLSTESRPGGQGYLTGFIRFRDDSTLYFKEYLDVVAGSINKLRYSYHYQTSDNKLIFRYDNARHKPPLGYVEHKHLPDGVIAADAPSLDAVLTEIANRHFL